MVMIGLIQRSRFLGEGETKGKMQVQNEGME